MKQPPPILPPPPKESHFKFYHRVSFKGSLGKYLHNFHNLFHGSVTQLHWTARHGLVCDGRKDSFQNLNFNVSNFDAMENSNFIYKTSTETICLNQKEGSGKYLSIKENGKNPNKKVAWGGRPPDPHLQTIFSFQMPLPITCRDTKPKGD